VRSDIKWTAGICTILVFFSLGLPAAAQVSPGKLSRPHAHLEGLRKCSNCHKLGNREVRAKCLDCHDEIAAMRNDGRGLHSGSDFDECVGCHVEHQGEDFDLIYWPDGRDEFDHRVTGFEITGAHIGQDCRKCHTAKYVVDASALKGRSKNLGRTYLGLEADCASCHDDVHRGRFKEAEQGCVTCHVTDKWKPAPGFDHGQTKYALTGKHETVVCDRCHRPEGENSAALFAGLPHAACTDCHKDPHVEALGPDCAGCHSTVDWKQISGEGFDHRKTRYPLYGKHAAVACAGCHGSRGARPAFERCLDCHADVHGAETRDRPDWLACESCHTVEGFRPARYTLEKHAAGRFPLLGAHQATPCDACHRPAVAESGASIPDLAPDHAACTDCHLDPHLDPQRSEPGSSSSALGCTGCHGLDGWRDVTFDHATTRFALDGRHVLTDCRACHRPAGEDLPFVGASSRCADCHDDIHAGQFGEVASLDCGRCHVTVDWLAEKFDHDRDSRFSLRGGHERVACAVCHLPLPENEGRSLRFKPLPVDCRACHTNTPSVEEEDR